VFSKSKKRFTGLIDVADIVAVITKHFSQDVLKKDNVEQFLSAKGRFTTLTVAATCNESHRNPWYPVDKSASVARVVDTCCRGNIRRVPLLEADGEFYTLVSQTDVISFIAQQLHSPLLQGLAQRAVRAGGIGTFGQVHSVAEADPALDAFRLISEHQVQGVAVVDAAGHMRANISASDLRVIQHQGASLAVLFESAKDFVAACREGSRVRPAGEGALAVGPEATFAETLLLMDKHRAHRLYVVDAEQRLLGVVSQIDLIRAVQTEMNK
jgi:CBS-domain-containing membrane protein